MEHWEVEHWWHLILSGRLFDSSWLAMICCDTVNRFCGPKKQVAHFDLTQFFIRQIVLRRTISQTSRFEE